MEEMEEVTDFVRGDSGETSVKEHNVLYQLFSATIAGENTNGINSAWNCDDSTKEHMISIISIEEGLEVLPLFEDYFNSLYCHVITKIPSSISCSISSPSFTIGELIARVNLVN